MVDVLVDVWFMNLFSHLKSSKRFTWERPVDQKKKHKAVVVPNKGFL